jgi:hypothetical protein
MDMLEKRLNDKGKNWRHVLKSLKVLDYCLHEGSELVVSWAKKNISIVESLRGFQHLDEDGRDVGQSVRLGAEELVALIADDDRLRNERADGSLWKSRVARDGSAAPSDAATGPWREAIRPFGGDDDKELWLALALSKKLEDERRQRELENPYQEEPLPVCGPDCVFKRLKQIPCDNSLSTNLDKRLGGRGFRRAVVDDSHILESPYKPLRRWQTRLVQIIPTSGEIPKCSLTTVEFIDMYGVGIAGTDEIVTYSAISYVWGKQEDNCTILCNDYPVQVSRNLAEFLCHLSLSRPAAGTPEYYWCDALCINQQNPTEKAFQVRNMLRIFEKADRVLGWLRPRDSIETLEGEPLLYAILSLRQLQDPQVKWHQGECAINLARAQKYLREVCDDAFFQRIWIRQEMFAARRISLFLGGQHYSPENQFDGMVSSLFQWLSLDAEDPTRKALESDDPLLDGRFGVDPRFQIMVRHFQHNGTDRHEYRPPAGRRRYSVHWLRTLQDGGSFHVTDPRDRVYGILGIISSTTTRLYVEDRPDIKTQNFPINYDKSVSEVYQDVVRFLIDTDRNLDCLTVFEDRRGLPSDLPSWAIDWRRDVVRSFIGVDADTIEDRAKYGLAVKQVDLQPGQLRVEGIRYFLIRSITAIKSWPEEMLRAKAEREPHALFNTMGWMDDAIVDLAQCYARCDHLKSLQDEKAVFHKPLLKADNPLLQLFVPRTTMLDDVIVFLKSARCLFVLRPVHGKESFFTLVGPVLGHQLVLPDVSWKSIFTNLYSRCSDRRGFSVRFLSA